MEVCKCIHIESSGWISGDLSELISIIKTAREEGKCFDCASRDVEPSPDPIYMCLKKECCKFGCSRNHRAHASKHYRSYKLHCLSINVMSLQVWCYECDDYVEGWDTIDEIRGEFDQNDDTEMIDIGGSLMNPTTSFINSKGNGSVGLYNTGNSCFINAALQILLNCPTLIGFFQENCQRFVVNRDRSGQEPSIADQFMSLMEAVNNPECPAAVSPTKLIRAASHFNPSFHGYSQQDSMDFIRMVLDRLHEELKYPVPSSALLKEGSNRKIRRKSGRLAMKNGTTQAVMYKSVISETFGGILRSEVQCHKCNKISVKDDQFFDLSLPLQPSPQASKSMMSSLFSSLSESLGLGSGKGMKLESAFVNFCLPEILDGKDRYFCESCNVQVQSTKTLTLKSLPQVLCVQLKRFRHDHFSSKVNNAVEYPVDGLDLRHFLHKEFIGSPLSSSSEYDLLGIVNHRGSFNGGHYVAYCRNLQTGRWLEFDDSRVREISEAELMTKQAYLLFYIQRSDPDRLKQRTEIINAISEVENSSRFVSLQWFNRLLNSGNPGPIDSFDVTCEHGNLKPSLFEGTTNIRNYLHALPDSEEFCDHMRNVYGELGAGSEGGYGILKDPVVCKKCIEEAEVLKRRRFDEGKAIQELDSSSIAEGESWYLIDSNWLHQWNSFKTGVQPPPGPISNSRLFKSGNLGVLRDNLSRGIHYRGVNEKVWNYFLGIYGGGPPIKRSTINIYN